MNERELQEQVDEINGSPHKVKELLIKVLRYEKALKEIDTYSHSIAISNILDEAFGREF